MTDSRTPRPWERRLKDLSFVLANCAQTYFDPELFRMHTNQFLQTARTVTFIIQKNKGGIPEFEAWYSSEVQENWRMDQVMLWARDARNKIEKIGDLELYSNLQATLMFSYLEEEDLALECERHELLSVGVKRLVRFARRQLPTGVSDTAAVRIERRWVATSLPNWELLHALTYVYIRLYACCNKLAVQLGGEIASDIPSDTAALHLTGEARHVTYVKLRGMKGFQSKTDRVGFDSGYEPPPEIRSAIEEHAGKLQKRDFESLFRYHIDMAKATFDIHGNHLSMVFLFGEEGNNMDLLSYAPEDQMDKFIFWRSLAERIAVKRVAGVIVVSEAWIRRLPRRGYPPVRDLPVIGERLQVVGLDRTGRYMVHQWSIDRSAGEASPALVPIPHDEGEREAVPTFLVPSMRAMEVEGPSKHSDVR